MATHITIFGDGAWGTAVAVHLAQQRGRRITLWSARPENARLLRERRENVRLLPGVSIPPSIHLTESVREAVAPLDLGIIAIPTVYLRQTLQALKDHLPADIPLLSLSKGIENETFRRPTEILHELFGSERLAVLSGPSHAEEVSRGLPTTVVVASEDLDLARSIQKLFSTERFRVYTNLDVIGVELGGALKNVVGIAAGIGDGLGFGDNAKAALLTRGVVEMVRFGVSHGAEPMTFHGLAGMGDLITTCMSKHGRNRQVGERLARGEKLSDILQGMAMVAEGVYTARSVHHRATRMGLEMPITTAVYQMLYENKSPVAAVNDLMLRAPRSEHGYKG